MMDAYGTAQDGRKQSIAFVSALQADHYGGYTAAIAHLDVDLVLSPSFIGNYWDDISLVHEVGHA